MTLPVEAVVEFGRLLATTRSSEVYIVRLPPSHVHYALKQVMIDKSLSPERKLLLENHARHELEILKYLADGHGAVKPKFYSRADDSLCLFLELACDGDLRNHSLRLRRGEKVGEGYTATRVFQGLSRALSWLHGEKGIIHADIKPGNILLMGNGRVVLGDFGLAFVSPERCVEPPESVSQFNKRRLDDLLYTYPYRPPEKCLAVKTRETHLRLRKEILSSLHSPAMDLWAMGVTMVECFYPNCDFDPIASVAPGTEEVGEWKTALSDVVLQNQVTYFGLPPARSPEWKSSVFYGLLKELYPDWWATGSTSCPQTGLLLGKCLGVPDSSELDACLRSLLVLEPTQRKLVFIS